MQTKNISVIIPTYNESLNIKILLAEIYKVIPEAKVIIVDDSNESEHKKIIELTAKTNAILLKRSEKLGRGSAVITGFKETLKDKNIEYVFEMDADLSHNPIEFPLFLEKMKEDHADLVVGTRYNGKGQISDWPKNRLIKSKAANLYLKSLLGINLTDYTSGYRLYSRRAVELLVNVNFKTSGFILHSESAYNLKKNEFIITEVPIHFKNRQYGESSIGSEKLFASFYGILKVRFSK